MKNDNLISKLKNIPISNYQPYKEIKQQSNSPIEVKHNVGELIDNSCLVKVKEIGNEIQLSHIKSVPLELPIERISDTHYRVKSTGEIREYKKSKTRDEHYKSLARTFRNLRELINNNFYGFANEKFITLTYQGLQRDEKKLYNDFKIWVKAIRRRYGKLDYINVVEPQATGSWHCHVLIRFHELHKENNYIDYNEFRSYWKHGSFVNVRSLEDVNNVGLYLSAYLTDIEVDDNSLQDLESDEEIVNKEINGKSKSIIKGGRLKYYPSGMNLYRCSRGIKKPIEYYSQKDSMDFTLFDLKHSNKIELLKDGNLVNTIHYEHYSLKK